MEDGLVLPERGRSTVTIDEDMAAIPANGCETAEVQMQSESKSGEGMNKHISDCPLAATADVADKVAASEDAEDVVVDFSNEGDPYTGPVCRPRAAKSSHFRGVSKTVRGKWQARLCVQSTQRNLGCSFSSPEEAAQVWDAAAILFFGHNLNPQMLNFPEEYKPNNLEGYRNFLVSVGATLQKDDSDCKSESTQTQSPDKLPPVLSAVPTTATSGALIPGAVPIYPYGTYQAPQILDINGIQHYISGMSSAPMQAQQQGEPGPMAATAAHAHQLQHTQHHCSHVYTGIDTLNSAPMATNQDVYQRRSREAPHAVAAATVGLGGVGALLESQTVAQQQLQQTHQLQQHHLSHNLAILHQQTVTTVNQAALPHQQHPQHQQHQQHQQHHDRSDATVATTPAVSSSQATAAGNGAGGAQHPEEGTLGSLLRMISEQNALTTGSATPLKPPAMQGIGGGRGAETVQAKEGEGVEAGDVSAVQNALAQLAQLILANMRAQQQPQHGLSTGRESGSQSNLQTLLQMLGQTCGSPTPVTAATPVSSAPDVAGWVAGRSLSDLIFLEGLQAGVAAAMTQVINNERQKQSADKSDKDTHGGSKESATSLPHMDKDDSTNTRGGGGGKATELAARREDRQAAGMVAATERVSVAAAHAAASLGTTSSAQRAIHRAILASLSNVHPHAPQSKPPTTSASANVVSADGEFGPSMLISEAGAGGPGSDQSDRVNPAHEQGEEGGVGDEDSEHGGNVSGGAVVDKEAHRQGKRRDAERENRADSSVSKAQDAGPSGADAGTGGKGHVQEIAAADSMVQASVLKLGRVVQAAADSMVQASVLSDDTPRGANVMKAQATVIAGDSMQTETSCTPGNANLDADDASGRIDNPADLAPERRELERRAGSRRAEIDVSNTAARETRSSSKGEAQSSDIYASQEHDGMDEDGKSAGGGDIGRSSTGIRSVVWGGSWDMDRSRKQYEKEDHEEGVDCLGWNEFQRVFRGQGVGMVALKGMYHTYRQGKKVPGLEAMPDMEGKLRRAELEADKARLTMACELYHFLMTAGEEAIDGELACAAAAALKPAVTASASEMGLSVDVTKNADALRELDESQFFGWTNWNDFQRLLRGKGISMHDLQDIYTRYKRHVHQLLTGVPQPPVPLRNAPDKVAVLGGSDDSQNYMDEDSDGVRLVRIPDTFMEFDAAGLQRRRRQLAAVEGHGGVGSGGSSFGVSQYVSEDENEHLQGGMNRFWGSRGAGEKRKRMLGAAKSLSGKGPARDSDRSERLRKQIKSQFKVVLDHEGNQVEVADHHSCLVCHGSVTADLWVACDTCESWQHQLCSGYLTEAHVPDKHYCDECYTLQFSSHSRRSIPNQMRDVSLSQPASCKNALSRDSETLGISGAATDAKLETAGDKNLGWSVHPSSHMIVDREVLYGRGKALYAATSMPDVLLSAALAQCADTKPRSEDEAAVCNGGGIAKQVTNGHVGNDHDKNGKNAGDADASATQSVSIHLESAPQQSFRAPPGLAAFSVHTIKANDAMPDAEHGSPLVVPDACSAEFDRMRDVCERVRCTCKMLDELSVAEGALGDDNEVLLRSAESAIISLQKDISLLAKDVTADAQPQTQAMSVSPPLQQQKRPQTCHEQEDAEEAQDVTTEVQIVLVHTYRSHHQPQQCQQPQQQPQQLPQQSQPQQRIKLGTVIMNKHQTIGRLRLKIRELLVQAGLAQTQTTFSMFKEIPREVVNRTSVQQQRVRVSLWPSQDGKRLGQVFRDSTAAISKDTHHRALVVLGPVVPRTACSPAVLSQLTLISLKPLISVLEEKKRLTAANTCSTPIAPPSNCCAPTARRPAQQQLTFLEPCQRGKNMHLEKRINVPEDEDSLQPDMSEHQKNIKISTSGDKLLAGKSADHSCPSIGMTSECKNESSSVQTSTNSNVGFCAIGIRNSNAEICEMGSDLGSSEGIEYRDGATIHFTAPCAKRARLERILDEETGRSGHGMQDAGRNKEDETNVDVPYICLVSGEAKVQSILTGSNSTGIGEDYLQALAGAKMANVQLFSESQYSPEKRKEDEQRSSEELLGGMAAQTNGSPRSVNETEEADKAALQKDGMLLENGEQKQGVEDVIVMDDVDMEVLEVTNRAEGENGEDRENEREEDMEEGKQVRKVELREEKKGGEDDIEKARGEEGKEVIGEKGGLEQMVNIETRSEVEEDCRLARELALTARRTANSHKSPFAKVAGGFDAEAGGEGGGEASSGYSASLLSVSSAPQNRIETKERYATCPFCRRGVCLQIAAVAPPATASSAIEQDGERGDGGGCNISGSPP